MSALGHWSYDDGKHLDPCHAFEPAVGRKPDFVTDGCAKFGDLICVSLDGVAVFECYGDLVFHFFVYVVFRLFAVA